MTTHCSAGDGMQRYSHSSTSTTITLVLAYVAFGVLHEVAHLAVASWLFFPSSLSLQSSWVSVSKNDNYDWNSFAHDAARAVLGRYSLIQIPSIDSNNNYYNATAVVAERVIRHAGWIFSLALAVICHILHVLVRKRDSYTKPCGDSKSKSAIRFVNNMLSILFHNQIIMLAAYVTAMEAIMTDLFGFIPSIDHNPPHNNHEEDSILLCFCGNFGLLLLNPSWLSIDGGKTALDILEKMVNVTMMRGAQSGGVVTFEPEHYLSKSSSSSSSSKTPALTPPLLLGVRSRVVNAKRTDLSKGVRRKIEKDNCERYTGKLRGWNKVEYNSSSNTGGGGLQPQLVRGFFGHTRFATSSKASFDGTHPHQWSQRRVYTVHSIGSQSLSSVVNNSGASGSLQPRQIAIENFITHNGDFDFFRVNGKFYDVEIIQLWLENVLHVPIPTTVDSAAVAGVIDLLRSQGSFALSIRYALCLTVTGSKVESDPLQLRSYPTMEEYEEIANIFETQLNNQVSHHSCTLEDISSDLDKRKQFASMTTHSLRGAVEDALAAGFVGESSQFHYLAMSKLSKVISSDVDDIELSKFVNAAIDAFFDNDLLHSTRLFLQNAKGSFGLMVASSLDAHRQICLAARGQTMSVAFYPRKGLICYGSEQAAVKAGLNYEIPGEDSSAILRLSAKVIKAKNNEADNAVRLDMDDLGGEICLLDWGYGDQPAVSPPNRHLVVEKMMNDRVNVVLMQESHMWKPLSKRLTLLEGNEFIKPLLDDCLDPVLKDIQDIPRICKQIQDDWHEVGLNRMTAWNLASCIRARMKAYVNGEIERHGATVDILVTGCEVSLWVAEQFVSDLQKSFPKLFIRAVSSNKLLGLFGHELVMPCIGFPYSQKAMDMKDPIVIIVSHSGGTFGPLACSNLLQSFSSSIFAVTSEWDTQIGKQLRSMYNDDLLSSRIFSTEVGVRPAEPCSVSVVATHQLLTNVFGHICITIISDPHFSREAGAVITERDLQILERCNQSCLRTLEEIVGVDCIGNEVHELRTITEQELRSAGDLWANHILENAKAYIMSFVYVVATVTSGFPLISALSRLFGLNGGERAFFIIRFLDALIYFWLPQTNITIIRLVEGRNLLHRMVGRTVVIGDCPWVAQSAEAFLGKIFACSYSIAGLTVLSGNPADHLVHRHTHRVVRGSLLVCGRPDGRLPALTSLEASTCLSVNQASSIQSLGGTCESITIGHNKSKLPLSHRAIYLKSNRPLFLSEKILDNIDHEDDLNQQRREKSSVHQTRRGSLAETVSRAASIIIENTRTSQGGRFADLSLSRSRKAKTTRSSASLIGAYVNLEKAARMKRSQIAGNQSLTSHTVNNMIKDNQGIDNARRVFKSIDVDKDGFITLDEFIAVYQTNGVGSSEEHLRSLFEEVDINDKGVISFDEFLRVAQMPSLIPDLGTKNRDSRGLVQVQASRERYFGEELRKYSPPDEDSMAMSRSQHFSMELYESRIASLQRFVAMTVMFHQIGYRVQSFFPKISFGLLGYRMDRTHSIMRIATTASPVSGADVCERVEELRLMRKIDRSVRLICKTWKNWKMEMGGELMRQKKSIVQEIKEE